MAEHGRRFQITVIDLNNERDEPIIDIIAPEVIAANVVVACGMGDEELAKVINPNKSI